ncbi:MAG: peptidoglycan-binding protein [Candidatus Taylorbacteria bacterium]|nr:peptidoglycan-binding protein [Candidatus Taylorbacteria bacterium]
MSALTKTAWTPEFANYFKSSWNDIVEWQKANKDALRELVKLDGIAPVVQPVYHNTVNPSVGIRLHGINKWANENNINIVVHVHFNDYPRKNASVAGTYTGFSIYVPGGQFFNSTSTKAVANTVFKRLAKYNPVSNLRGERSGIIEEQDLIAIGSNNSVDAASLLIEYAYIYEPQLVDPKVRELYLKEIAYETYIGLLDFFDPAGALVEAKTFDTLTLPYKWNNQLTGKNDSPQDVFALQTALILDGVYPPAGLSSNECPRTGKLGPCTRSALQTFQHKYDINNENGIAGPKTIETLNRIYSARTL